MPGASRPMIDDAPLALRSAPWPDYTLIDSGGGRKLERYGAVTVVRPEAQCLWAPALDEAAWAAADAVFEPSDEDEAGRWRLAREVPETWPMRWRDVAFLARLTAFRHLGVFPEQAANWAWLDERARAGGAGARVLNLFSYTGIASLVMAKAGAQVTHVDASKKAVGWARENGGAETADIRWICEDARKWVARGGQARIALRRNRARPAEIRSRAGGRGLAPERGFARLDRGLRRFVEQRCPLPPAQRLFRTAVRPRPGGTARGRLERARRGAWNGAS